MGALLLTAPSATAKSDGHIKLAAAQDYPAANVTYNGTASPGVITHLCRNGKRDKYADLVLSKVVGGPVVLCGTGGERFADRRFLNNRDTDAYATATYVAYGVPVTGYEKDGAATRRGSSCQVGIPRCKIARAHQNSRDLAKAR